MNKILELNAIRIDGGTQPRERIDENVVAEYANAMRDGAIFPPVVVFHDGVDNWLADGFHRLHATRKIEANEIACSVQSGTKREAILYAVGANASHGVRRTNDDKRRAVMTLLNDAEWSHWSNREIARRCAVHSTSVDKWRAESQPIIGSEDSERTFKNKHGGISIMRTETIGRIATRAFTPKPWQEASEVRAAQIKEFVRQGNVLSQITEEMGISQGRVQSIAKQYGIKLHDRNLRGKRIDNRKIVEETVNDLEAAASSLRTLQVSVSGISKPDALEWAKSLGNSIREFNSLRKQLQEHGK